MKHLRIRLQFETNRDFKAKITDAFANYRVHRNIIGTTYHFHVLGIPDDATTRINPTHSLVTCQLSEHTKEIGEVNENNVNELGDLLANHFIAEISKEVAQKNIDTSEGNQLGIALGESIFIEKNEQGVLEATLYFGVVQVA